jgi:regulator of RNase E activity RraB
MNLYALQQQQRQREAQKRKAGRRSHMLVMRGLRNDQLELRERAAVQAFTLGYATTEHYHILADMHSVMLLAGSTDDSRK